MPCKHGDMALLEAVPPPEIREKQEGKGGDRNQEFEYDNVENKIV